MRAAFPLNGVVLRLVSAGGDAGEVGQNLGIKIAPNQLAEPGGGALTALNLPLQGGGGQLADRHRAKAQVHAQVAGAFHGRKVAGVVVLVHALKEVFKQLRPARGASGDFELAEVGGLKPELFQRRHWFLQRFGPRRQNMRQWDRIVGLQMLRRDGGQPVVFIRREHTIRVAALGQNFAFLKHHMVFAGAKGDTPLGQVVQHLGITR